MSSQELISIIIPTDNSEHTIETCLKSCRGQTYQTIETIVVDNFSRDGTRKIAEKFHANVIQSRARRAEARNIGASNSIGNWFLFLDSDMEMSPSVVEQCVSFSKSVYDTLIIPEVSVGVGYWAKCRALEKSRYLGDDLIEAPRFFRRKTFESVGGYDVKLEAGEDWDLNQRVRNAGYAIGRINSTMYHHEGELSITKMMRKKHHYGKTIGGYMRRHPTEAKKQFSLIRPAFVRHRKRLMKDPAHSLGMLFMKGCEAIALWLGKREAFDL